MNMDNIDYDTLYAALFVLLFVVLLLGMFIGFYLADQRADIETTRVYQDVETQLKENYGLTPVQLAEKMIASAHTNRISADQLVTKGYQVTDQERLVVQMRGTSPIPLLEVESDSSLLYENVSFSRAVAYLARPK